jgi:hypothetical protein
MAMARDSADNRCALCGRQVSRLTRHHLVPRSRSRRVEARSTESRPTDQTVELCSPCHKMVHATISETDLAKHYHTIDALLEHQQIARFVDWVRHQPDGHVAVHRPRTRRRARGRR